jgi:molecular chaperone GrpE
MNTKIEVKTDKDSEREKAIQDEEVPIDKSQKAKEKPLENMTKSELLEKINEIQEESQKNHDLYLRSEAEIENVKKRNKKDKEEWVKYANESLIKEILPVVDNLEMAISHSQDENSVEALREGVELTLKGLRDTLEKSGLEVVKAEGEPFDPNYHHAVSEQADEKVETGRILQELQRGYTLNKRLIRPAMVIVSKGSADNAADDDQGQV